MNGNDLNNMAQRYKEEMMRLYHKSGSHSDNSHSGSMTQQSTSPNAHMNERDISGTPVTGVPNASYYNVNGSGQGSMNDRNAASGNCIAANCTCRFPSADSIINCLANTPVTLPLTPEDNPPPVGPVQGEMTPIQPRNNSAAMGAQNYAPAAVGSIMLNAAPATANYTVPSESENEQEIFPDFRLPADIPAESVETAPSTRSYSPSMPWISMTGDDSWGFLQFEVFTGDGAIPVPGAMVTVKKELPGGAGLVRILFTNRSGKTPTIALPAPSQAYSQYPDSTVRPFSDYKITVRARGYYTLSDINLPVFSGVKTVQPIDLIPLPEYSQPIQPRTDMDGGSSVG